MTATITKRTRVLQDFNQFSLKMFNECEKNSLQRAVVTAPFGCLHCSLRFALTGGSSVRMPFPPSPAYSLHENCPAILALHIQLAASCHQIFHTCKVPLPASLWGEIGGGGGGQVAITSSACSHRTICPKRWQELRSNFSGENLKSCFPYEWS